MMQASDLSKKCINIIVGFIIIINLFHSKAKSVYLIEFYGYIRYFEV